jgi:hypothetical protein
MKTTAFVGRTTVPSSVFQNRNEAQRKRVRFGEEKQRSERAFASTRRRDLAQFASTTTALYCANKITL